MKKIAVFLALCLILSILTSSPIFAANVNVKADKEPVDKIVFVHYPKHETVRPSPGGGTSLTGVMCPDYKYSGIRWANDEVTYYVNDNSKVAGAANAIEASMDTWDNAAGSALTFIYGGSKNVAAGGNSDGFNVISWADITQQFPNAIAVTSIWYTRGSRLITEVDTQMNSGTGFEWSVTDPGTLQDLSLPATIDTERYKDSGVLGDEKYDVQNIMTHEAGHWLMLNDLYKSKDSQLTMYGYGDIGELNKDSLGYGDELGVEAAYN
ncbi:MAG: hypothetical protein ACYCYI_10325 [Saccharofermentanales bacterium]